MQKSWFGSLKGRNYLETQAVIERIILKCILKVQSDRLFISE
jgi:hypothetical protein